MTRVQETGPSCSLDGRAFEERVQAIAAFNDRALVRRHREGQRLTLTYAVGTGSDVAALVAKENECCSFLQFEVNDTSEGVELAITVPTDRSTEADRLLAPFDGTDARRLAASCCGQC